MLSQITPLLITYNEAPNIGRVLDRLRWAERIVVVDSGSDDGTIAIVSQFPQVEMFHRPFDTFAAQCNFGLAQIRAGWVLSMDADYILSRKLIAELDRIDLFGPLSGFRAGFRYCIFGKPLRGGLYPRRTVLFRVATGHYVDEGHGHRVVIDGQIGDLVGKIDHDDRKPLLRWFAAQQRYADVEAEHLLRTPHAKLSRSDRIRRLAWPAPILVFFYVLFGKGCIFDGWIGWFYALQRLVAEAMIALAIIDRRRANVQIGSS